MKLNDVYEMERKKWDSLALEKSSRQKALSRSDNFYKYAQRTSTMVGVGEFLGDLSGKHVLEYGGGLGEISLLLARSKAKVTTFDISEQSINVIKARAHQHNLLNEVRSAVSTGERLPFADESFDVVFGKAILHHLDVDIGWHELYRVLRPEGKAVFVEPMGMNPVLNFVRDFVPYPHKNPRGADHPLDYGDIDKWGRNFNQFDIREIQLFSMLERGLGFNKKISILRKLDELILARLPFLRRFCRYVVLYMVK